MRARRGRQHSRWSRAKDRTVLLARRAFIARLIALRRSRMSFDSSLMPSSPAFLLAVQAYPRLHRGLRLSAILRSINSSTPGSMSPVRVPLMIPRLA